MYPSIKVRWLLIAALFFGVSCSFFSGIAEKAAPQPQGEGVIAYLGVDGNIYTSDRSGLQRVAITRDANLSPASGETGRVYLHPAWSPDGSTLAFVGFSGSSALDQQATLYAASPDGADLRQPFQSGDYFPFYLYWSPDSRAVTFLSNTPDGSGLTLHMAQVDGAGIKVLGTGQPFYWAWAPDNASILIHTGGSSAANASASLAFLSVGDTSQSKLELRPASFQAPDWQPGGEAMALAVEDGDGQNALVIIDRNGSIHDSLSPLASPAAFAWSPQGDRLAYTEQSEGRASNVLNVVDVGSDLQFGAPRRLDHEVLAFYWSPDGASIAFITLSRAKNGGALFLRRAQSSPLINLDLYVAEAATGATRLLTTFSPADGFLETIPFFDQYQRSSTLWSPDSRWLVIAAEGRDAPPGIFVLDAASGGSTRIADGVLAFWSAR